MSKTKMSMKKKLVTLFISIVLVVGAGVGVYYGILRNLGTADVNYTITFDTNGGGEISTITRKAGESIYPPLSPFIIGYTFDGWYTDDGTFLDEFTFTTMPEKSFTLYAKWTEIQQEQPPTYYTITFNSNGGDSVSAIMEEAGESITEPQEPTKTGYTFAGWYTESIYTNEYSFSVMPAESFTLYAKWIANVTLNKQDGTGGSDNISVIYGGSMPTGVTAPTRYGYLFTGYYDATVGGTQYYDHNMESVNAWYKSSDNPVLYARWITNSFTVTLDKQSGTGGTSSVTAINGDDMPAATAPTRTGYTFVGYFTEAEGGGTKYYNADMTSAKKWDRVANTTLYACWTGNIYTVSLDKQDGTGGNNIVGAVYGSPMPSEIVAPTKAGYIFAGYYDAVSYGTQYYNQNMGSVRDWDKTTANPVLYARWLLNSFNVTLNMQSGTGGSTSVVAINGEDMPVATAPTRVGYTFEGYFAETNGNGDQYYNDDMSSAKEWDKTASATLYAYWTANTYEITFDKLEGDGGSDGVDATFGSAMPSATAPTLEGYSFSGYYDMETGGTQYYTAIMLSARTWDIASDTILYARWTAKTFTITFDKQGGSYGSSSATATYGQLLPEASAPSKTGYVFAGYFDAAEGGTQYYAADMSRDIIWSRLSSITLYARWMQANTVTFDKQSGTGGTNSVEVRQGFDMPAATAPTRTGYTFAGYYDAIEEGVQYYTAAMESARTWDKDANATLYARWVGNTYTVLLDKQEGAGGSSMIQVTYGSPMPFAIAPTKAGLIFIGYYDGAAGGKRYYDREMASCSDWDKLTDNITLYANWVEFESGKGTEANPFKIVTAQHLTNVNDARIRDSHFVLLNDIDLGNAEWTPITDFYGVFDGGNHVIRNFKITTYAQYLGFISSLYGQVKNLGLDNINLNIPSHTGFFNWTSYRGGIAGWMSYNATISDCHVNGTVSTSLVFSNYQSDSSFTTYVGGLVGYKSGGSINNSFSTGNVYASFRCDSGNSDVYAGGLVGYNSGPIQNSYSTANVTAIGRTTSSDATSGYYGGYIHYGKAFAGGLAGYSAGNFSNSYATGSVNATGRGYGDAYAYAGGLVGVGTGHITNSFAIGSVSATATGGSSYRNETEKDSIGSMQQTNCYSLSKNPVSRYDLEDPYFYTLTLGWDANIWNLTTLDFSTAKYPSLLPDTDTITEVVVRLDPRNEEEADSLSLTYGDPYGDLTVPEKYGYTFAGWWTNIDGKGVEVTSETIVSRGNHTLYAKWTVISGIEVSFDLQEGTGVANSIFVTYDSAYGTLASFPTKDGYIFDGWYSEENGEGTLILSSTIVKIATAHTLYAKWIENEPQLQIEYTRINASGVPTSNGDYILFGEYPQTIKANDVSITAMTDGRGYYLGSDNFYYAKVTATPYASGYEFSTNSTVSSGTVYYFKVEPIKWRILEESDGTALILCESIIANKRYHASSNNYMNSEIRAWLNNEFYNTAFSALQKELIQITNVDNSAYSTGYSSNPYACANTDDKIFLPSYREMVNTAYGFSSDYSAYDAARRRLTSDYSRATGASMSTSSSYYGNGSWWLRSPYIYYSYGARYVYTDGIADSYVSFTDFGVVPALTIQLS